MERPRSLVVPLAALLVVVTALIVLAVWGFSTSLSSPASLKTAPVCGPLPESAYGACPQAPTTTTTTTTAAK